MISTPRTTMFLVAILVAMAPYLASALSTPSMWQILESQPPPQAWKTIFGTYGERGEYMDGYTPEAMLARCKEDYQWDGTSKDMDAERAKMMSFLYDHEPLWEHTCMVAFAEHYLQEEPFQTFQRHKASSSLKQPIFGGVVWKDWRNTGDPESKLSDFKKKGIDYVRLECNFGDTKAVDDQYLQELSNNPLFEKLAQAAHQCQTHQMVPLILMQVPWRDPNDRSLDCFTVAVQSLAKACQEFEVSPARLLLETRPPIGVSAVEEEQLSGPERIGLGFTAGQEMLDVLDRSFTKDKITGFCVAGGSTKGQNPTAMQDDTQNAVRQGMRRAANYEWGYEACFWEMGAKLMLQPKVGQLWGRGDEEAARKLFAANAKDLAEEIKISLRL